MIAALAVLATLSGKEGKAGKAGAPDDDDEALIARHRAGDREAFATLYRNHAAAVYRRLSRILGPVPDRDDLTQDVFLALHRALPAFRGEARLTTLIHRIAINKACEHLRRNSRRPAVPTDSAFFDDLLSLAASPAERASWREELERVFACLAKIKPKKRVALLLRLVDGLSFEDIAVLVDATPEAVAKRVQHGQRELDELFARASREARLA